LQLLYKNGGGIVLCVDEQNSFWLSLSLDYDQRAITAVCASDMTKPYAMKPDVYAALAISVLISAKIKEKEAGVAV
jgi:hypothetical protein